MPAEDLAAKLVEAVLAERPEGVSGRAAVLLNGLAPPSTRNCLCCTATSTNSSKQLASCRCPQRWASWSPVSIWPAARSRSPGWTRSSKAIGSRQRTPRLSGAAPQWQANGSPPGAPVPGHVAQVVTAEASEDSIAAAAIARTAVDAIYAVVEENKEYLGRIDAIAGDGDHGIGMSRPWSAAAEAATRPKAGSRRY